MKKHSKTKTKQLTTDNWKTDLSEPILTSTLKTEDWVQAAERFREGQPVIRDEYMPPEQAERLAILAMLKATIPAQVEEMKKAGVDDDTLVKAWYEKEEAKKNYLIRIPREGLPNDGKIPGLNTAAFKEFVYTRIDVECMTYDKSGEKIVAWMVDETKCEYAVWFKKAAEELEVWGAPKKNWWKGNVDSEYRKWKMNQKNKAEDKKVLSAGRVGKTAGVKAKKSAFGDDPNAYARQSEQTVKRDSDRQRARDGQKETE